MCVCIRTRIFAANANDTATLLFMGANRHADRSVYAHTHTHNAYICVATILRVCVSVCILYTRRGVCTINVLYSPYTIGTLKMLVTCPICASACDLPDIINYARVLYLSRIASTRNIQIGFIVRVVRLLSYTRASMYTYRFVRFFVFPMPLLLLLASPCGNRFSDQRTAEREAVCFGVFFVRDL